MSKIIIGTLVVIAYFFIIIPTSAIIGIPAEIPSIIAVLAISIIALYRHISQGSSLHATLKYHLPFQVLKLVQQAHANREFNTEPHITVSAEMREKLTYPLGPSIAAIIGTTEYPVTENDIKYDVAESKYINNDLHVTVSINIDYCDTAKHIDVHYHNILMHIVCSPSKYTGLYISSVEHN